MLALQQHFSQCESCEAERRSIRQVKTLLRALHQPRPRPDLPSVISVRLTEAEQSLWRVQFSTTAPPWPARPQRGRRLATALALSCLTMFSFAAACFAPAAREGALTSSGFLLSTEPAPTPSMLATEAGPTLLTAAPRNGFFDLTEADVLRRERLFVGHYEAPVPSELRLSNLPDDPSSGYAQGQAAFAAYRTR